MEKPTPDPAMYRGILATVTEKISDYTEGDPAAIFMTGMTYFSHAAGAGPTVWQGGLPHSTVIWTLIVGNSATGRKGESRRIMADLFSQALPKLSDKRAGFFFKGFPQSGAALVTKLAELEWKNIEKKNWVVPGHHPALVVDEEFAGVFKNCTRDKLLSTYLREFWQSDTIEHSIRKGDKIVTTTAEEPHLVILGHCTPQEMRRVLGAADIEGGLANRILCVAAKKSKSLPFPEAVPDRLALELSNMIRAAARRAAKTRDIHMTSEAVKYWRTLHAELDGLLTQSAKMENWIGRIHAYTMRLAGLYALTTNVENDKPRITVNDLKAARAVVLYSIESAKYAMGGDIGSTLSPIAEKILQIASTFGPLSLTELSRKLGGRKTKPEIRKGIAELLGKVVIWKSEEKTGGRKGFMVGTPEHVPLGADIIDDPTVTEEGDKVPGEVIDPTAVVRAPRPPAPRQEAMEEPQRASKPVLRVVGDKYVPAPAETVREEDSDELEGLFG